MAEKEPALSLDAIVRDVANQLQRLRENPLPKDPVIRFSGCEIELSVKATVEGGGGVRFYIFSAQAKAANEQLSKIKLSFGAAGTPLVMLTQSTGEGPDLKCQEGGA